MWSLRNAQDDDCRKETTDGRWSVLSSAETVFAKRTTPSTNKYIWYVAYMLLVQSSWTSLSEISQFELCIVFLWSFLKPVNSVCFHVWDQSQWSRICLKECLHQTNKVSINSAPSIWMPWCIHFSPVMAYVFSVISGSVRCTSSSPALICKTKNKLEHRLELKDRPKAEQFENIKKIYVSIQSFVLLVEHVWLHASVAYLVNCNR